MRAPRSSSPGAAVRMSDLTSVSLLNLDDRITQLQVAQGRVNVRVRVLPRGETFEIATPNAAFTIERARRLPDRRRPVKPARPMIAIRDGAGSVYGDGAAFALRRGRGRALLRHRPRAARVLRAGPGVDTFDRWARERDRRFESSYAARYVSPEIVGYGDLDTTAPGAPSESYGNVWFPRDVPQGWAPYRYGHWSWIDPWGWTWVDDAPWGFAPFRTMVAGRTLAGCGVGCRVRCASARSTRLRWSRSSAAPISRFAFRSGPSGGGIGWFPLAPGEVYRPAYVASRDYVRNVNVSNTIVNTTVINNVYQNNVTHVNYRNVQVANAVTAVPPAVFAQSQPVQRNAVAVSRDVAMRGQVTSVAAVAPTPMGITGAARATNNRPAPEVLQRSVVARSAPPAPVAPAAQRVEMLQRDPGKPLERPAIAARQGVTTAAPNVRVVSNATPQALPPRGREGAEQKAAPPPPTNVPPAAARQQRDISPSAAQLDERGRAIGTDSARNTSDAGDGDTAQHATSVRTATKRRRTSVAAAASVAPRPTQCRQRTAAGEYCRASAAASRRLHPLRHRRWRNLSRYHRHAPPRAISASGRQHRHPLRHRPPRHRQLHGRPPRRLQHPHRVRHLRRSRHGAVTRATPRP